MVDSHRTVEEGIQYQGQNEERIYRVQTTPWGMTAALPPVSPTAKAYEHHSNDEVTATVLSGSCAIDSDTKIKTPTVKSLTPGILYRIEVLFTWQGNTLEFALLVECDHFG